MRETRYDINRLYPNQIRQITGRKIDHRPGNVPLLKENEEAGGIPASLGSFFIVCRGCLTTVRRPGARSHADQEIRLGVVDAAPAAIMLQQRKVKTG